MSTWIVAVSFTGLDPTTLQHIMFKSLTMHPKNLNNSIAEATLQTNMEVSDEGKESICTVVEFLTLGSTGVPFMNTTTSSFVTS